MEKDISDGYWEAADMDGRSALRLAPERGASPALLEPELVRALNERIAIIDGMAELLLLSTAPDRTAKAALHAIRRQAQGVRELFLRP